MIGDAIVEERLTDATHAGTVVWSYLVDDTGAIVTATRSFGGSQAAYDGTYLVTWSGHGDALGLWKIEATGALTLANAYTYSTWGAPTTSTHNSYPDLGFRFTYVGQHDVQWDTPYGLGLAYMHARHYAPALGRFLQPDPVAAEANAWAYAANSPVTYVDPCGTFNQKYRSLGCQSLKKLIWLSQNELNQRHWAIRTNPRNLPLVGKDSVASHLSQYLGRQANLRLLLDAYRYNRCGPPPPGAWTAASRRAPVPARVGPPRVDVLSRVIVLGGTTITVGALLYFAAKGLSPLCGPAWAACVLVL